MNLNFNISSQIQDDINTIEHILDLKIFETISDIYIQKSLFTQLMISLRDLIRKSEIYSNKIDFDDDVIKITRPQKVSNVSDLIAFIRNALCHEDSLNHKYNENITLSYNVLKGKFPNAIVIGQASISSDYEDDICIIFGFEKIYYHRHIIRAFKECKNNLLPLLNNRLPEN
ncbi:MAG: hypothetical protein J6A89_04195 [Clostridia bacterium]|nr:hypothetical protein [Clostridia bacterium]